MWFKFPVFNTSSAEVKQGQRYILEWTIPQNTDMDYTAAIGYNLLDYARIESLQLRNNKLEATILITHQASPLLPIIVICTTVVAAMVFFHIDAPKVYRAIGLTTLLVAVGVVGLVFWTGFGKHTPYRMKG